MGRIGKTYPRTGSDNSTEALRHFARSMQPAEERAFRFEIIVAVLALIAVFGVIAWGLSL